MRDKISVLYYPDMNVSDNTLKKAILLFDEIHFMDRPSLSFGNFGSIGCASPFRQHEESFRENGVPLYTHDVNNGKVRGELLQQVMSDINDLSFLKEFKEGLEKSPTFRGLQIPAGNYGAFGNENNVAQKIINTDFISELKSVEKPETLLSNESIKPFELNTALGCTKQLVCNAALCSAIMNNALAVCAIKDFIPLADAAPYGRLLKTRYLRAINKLEPKKHKIPITDISFAIFDEIIPSECVEKLNLKEVVDYRRKSENAREAFLEHLLMLQEKQSNISINDNYEEIINKLVITEIMPAVRSYRNKLETIDENFFGSLGKGVLGAVGGSSTISLFSELSLEKMVLLGGTVGTYILKAAIDEFLAARAVKRDCSLSYILSLDK